VLKEKSVIKISIIIPAKNEQAAIGSVVERILQTMTTNQIEIIVVNDGSTDKTAEFASHAGAKVISHPYSKGNGATIKTGARAATGEVIVFMDADGQHAPEDIPRLLAKLTKGFDMVVGARQKGSQASVGRSIANKFYNRFASYMTGHKIEDLTSGFRAVNAEKFRQFISLLPNGFSYPTTSTMAFFRAGYSVAYEPIIAAQREDESQSHINLVKDGIRFLLIIFKVGTLYSPLKLFLPISVSVFLTGLSYYAYTYFSIGRFTNMSALMFSTSLIIFMVGLVSEQITALMYKDSE
jgi:glycosyltransferase involved in cell wall biosynthesis